MIHFSNLFMHFQKAISFPHFFVLIKQICSCSHLRNIHPRGKWITMHRSHSFTHSHWQALVG